MADTSPSTASSATSPDSIDGFCLALPPIHAIEGRTIRLVPLEASHLDGLWSSLKDPNNTRLFAYCYKQPCRTREHLWATLSEYRADDLDSMTLTILDKRNDKAIGWTVLQTVADPSTTTVHCALFLPRLSRSERGTETIHYLGRLLFDSPHTNTTTLSFRAGTLSESTGPRGGPMGMSLIGILSRQLRVDGDSSGEKGDLYVLRRKEWPFVREAVAAWLDAREGRAVGGVMGGLGNVGLLGMGLEMGGL